MRLANDLLRPATGAAQQTIQQRNPIPKFTGEHAVGVTSMRVGCPGQWRVEFMNDTRSDISRSHILRAVRSLGFTAEKLDMFRYYHLGSVMVAEDPSERMLPSAYRTAKVIATKQRRADKSQSTLLFTVNPQFFQIETEQQERLIEDALSNLSTIKPSRIEAPNLSVAILPEEMPRIVLIGFPEAVVLGQKVLRQELAKVVGPENIMVAKRRINEAEAYGHGSSITLDSEAILSFKPDWIVISALSMDWEYVHALQAWITEYLPDTLKICGGWGPTREPETFAAYLDMIDIFIRGKGEYELPRLVKGLGKKLPSQLNPFIEEFLSTFSGSFMDLGKIVFINNLDTVNTTTDEGFVLLESQSNAGGDIYMQEGCSAIEKQRRLCGFCNQIPVQSYGATPQAVYANLLQKQQALADMQKQVVRFIGDDSLMRRDFYFGLWQLVKGSPLEGRLDLKLVEASTRNLVLKPGEAKFDLEYIDVLLRLGLSLLHIATDFFSDRSSVQLRKGGYSLRDDLLVGDLIASRGVHVTRNLIAFNAFSDFTDIAEVLVNYHFIVEQGGRLLHTLNPFAYPIQGTNYSRSFIQYNLDLMEARNNLYRRLLGKNHLPDFFQWVKYPEDNWVSRNGHIDTFLYIHFKRIFKQTSTTAYSEENPISYPFTIVDPLDFVCRHLVFLLPEVVENSFRSNGVFRESKLALLYLLLNNPRTLLDEIGIEEIQANLRKAIEDRGKLQLELERFAAEHTDPLDVFRQAEV